MEYQEMEGWMDEAPGLDIGKIYADWKVSGKPIVDAIMANYPEPKPELTEKQRKGAQLAAALTDATASLAEMFAAGQGAYVRNREGKTSLQTTNERLREIQDKYDKDLLHRQSAKGNAEMQDFNQYLALKQQEDGYKRQHALYKRKRADEEAKYRRERADKQADEKTAHERQKDLIGWKNQHDLKVVNARSEAGGYGGSKKDKPQLVYEVTPNLKRGNENIVDTTTGKARRYELTKEGYQKALNAALADEELQNMPGLWTVSQEYNTRDEFGNPVPTGYRRVPVSYNALVQAYLEKLEAGEYDDILRAIESQESEELALPGVNDGVRMQNGGVVLPPVFPAGGGISEDTVRDFIEKRIKEGVEYNQGGFY